MTIAPTSSDFISSGRTRPVFTLHRNFPALFKICLLYYVVLQIPYIRDSLNHLAIDSADSTMRMMSVRDLLAGQSWFDTTQYRILPPEGMPLHWSRYVDAPIAALVLLLSPILGVENAEKITGFVYPFLLFVALLAIVAFAAFRIAGTVVAATSAIMATSTCLVLMVLYFGAGALDHHNVQILLVAVMFGCLAIPTNCGKYAAISGFAASLSLAVGFENLPMVALAGLLCSVRFFLMDIHARERLFGFGAAMAISAPLLMAGQTAPDAWLAVTCDTLSAPWVALAMVAGLWSVGTVLVTRNASTRLSRVKAGMLLGIPAALAIGYALQPCLAGPFTHLPDEIVANVLPRIKESRPLLSLLMDEPIAVLTTSMPVLITASAAIALALFARPAWADEAARPQEAELRRRLLEFAVIMLIPFALSLIQFRAMILAIGLYPIVFGLSAVLLVNSRQLARWRLSTLLKTLIIVAALSPPWAVLGGVIGAFDTDETNPDAQGVTLDDTAPLAETDKKLTCVDPRALAVLNEFAPGLMFSSINFGPGLILHTHHDALTGSYHRSSDAMVNGTVAFWHDEERLLERIRHFRPDYLLLCRDEKFWSDDSIGTQLAKDDASPLEWLEEMKFEQSPLKLYRVKSDAL